MTPKDAAELVAQGAPNQKSYTVNYQAMCTTRRRKERSPTPEPEGEKEEAKDEEKGTKAEAE